ncbi:MAG: GNAT family N-acetyltransferase [Lachnospiraceae bacterium]|nr:GNAT family N-acetyltransferase [Lachnospiraceae bacterium]
MLYTYQTDRLTLKILHEDAAGLTTEFFRKNKEHFSPWESSHPPGYYTEEYQRQVLAAESVQHLRSQAVRYFLFRTGEPQVIGTAGFSLPGYSPESCCRLGYRLDFDYTGQGFMTEALQFLIPKVFFFYHLHRMEANILPENAPSLRLVKRLGFQAEGTARGYAYLGGRYRDHLRYSLLSQDVFPQSSDTRD